MHVHTVFLYTEKQFIEAYNIFIYWNVACIVRTFLWKALDTSIFKDF